MRPIRLCFLVSGSGTTMQAILEAIKKGSLPYVEPVLVIASKPGIGAIEKARTSLMRQNDVVTLPLKDFSSHEAFGRAILRIIAKRGITIIGQYGWLPRTPSNVIEAFWGRIINQHPAPLDPGYPDFGGKYMYGLAAVAARFRFAQLVGREAMWTEATAHHVVDEVDKGKLIATKQLEILPDDTPDTLQSRLLPVEWQLQIETLRAFTAQEGWRSPSFVRRERLITTDTEHFLREAKLWGIEYARSH